MSDLNVTTTVRHVGAHPPAAGHNTVSGNASVPKETVTGHATSSVTGHATVPSKVAADQLRSVVTRIEAMEEERKVISDDIRDVYTEAKGNGYDVKALRTIVRLRKMDASDRAEQETILETYMQAMGML
jgi:uncharacterized protein (UPF0335 family)